MSSSNVKYMSPYRRGADDGFMFGAYLAVMFVAFFYQWRWPLLAMVVLLMMAGVPVVTYFCLRRSYRADGGATLFSSLWMQGIVMFFCGSLLSGLVAYLMMRFVDRGWMLQMANIAIEALRQSPDPQAREALNIFQNIVDYNLLPSPIAIVFQSVWTAVVTGSVLSLLAALLVRAVGRRKVDTWAE